MKRIATFRPTPPYDFLRTVRASAYYTTLGRVSDGAYWRAVRTDDSLALVRLTGRGPIEAPEIDAQLVAWRGRVDQDLLRARLARMLNPQLDLGPFYAMAREDPALWRVVEPLYGLHILQTETLFEALCVTVIEQQIALSAAQRGERWLIEWAGDEISHHGLPYRTFPEPAAIARATVQDLTPLKITFRRMEVLSEAAKRELAESFESLRDVPGEEAYRALVSLKGVGHWTAAWTMNRGLGQLVYVGAADVALRAAAYRYFVGQPGRFTVTETDALFARFGAHAGLAAYYVLMKWAFDRYPMQD